MWQSHGGGRRLGLLALSLSLVVGLAATALVPGPAVPAVVAAMRPAARTTPIDTSLLRNRGAEMGGGGYPEDVVPLVAGWRRTGNFTVTAYQDGLLPEAEARRIRGGRNYFSCGPMSRDARARQRVRLNGRNGEIDRGRLKVRLRVAVSAPATEGDRARVMLRFLGPSQRSLGSKASPWVSGTPRGFITTTIAKIVPKGTRAIAVTLRGVRNAGLYCNAYFDKVDLRLIRR